MTTNQEVVNALEALHEKARKRDTKEGFFADELRRLLRDYRDLHNGTWNADADRAADVFSEHFSVANGVAKDCGCQDFLGELNRIERTIFT